MRGATECAKRLKPLVSSLRSRLGKVGHPPITDAITQLILGVLSRDTPETKASEGLARLRGTVVDYNELRVIPPIELAEVLGDFPDARLKCEDISRALNSVFAREHAVTLDGLANLSKKDLLAALDEIDGIEAYTRARIRLLALGKHAVPLDEAMWALARAREIVDPRCPLDEAQRFLERQIAADHALEFFALLKKQAWTEMGSAVRKREVESITSVPPDRTSRNMLQMVTRATAPGEAIDDEADETPTASAPTGPTVEPRPSATAPAAAKTPARKKSARPPRSATSKRPARKKTQPAARKTTAKSKKGTRAGKARARSTGTGAAAKARAKRGPKATAKAESA